MVQIPFQDKSFSAYISNQAPGQKQPGLILIHEVWGLDDHIKEVADRFAKQGYLVLAPDLLSETGILKIFDEQFLADLREVEKRPAAQLKMRPAMGPIQSPEFAQQTVEKLKACVDLLLSHADCNGKIAVLGFCFGGTYSFELAVEDPRLNCAVVFYGHAPEPLDKLVKINCPILAFYGEKDTALVEALPSVKDKMSQYGKSFEAVIYPNTGHAFFNNTNPLTYNQESALDSFQKTLDFLTANLK